MKRSRLAPQSPRRVSESRLRRKLVLAYLTANPVCERCWAAAAVDVHERQKRSRNSRAWLDPSLFCALCRTCHEWTEAEPALATQEGWLLPSWWRPVDSAGDGQSWEAS